MISEVYDLEVLSNLFTYTGFCRQSKTYTQFVIHDSRNDLIKLVDHITREGLIMIGFNNDNYDYSRPMDAQHLGDEWDDYTWSADDF